MARVDPRDDGVWRLVVFHYRFDPDRRQRRQVEVAAFDNEAEFDADVERRRVELVEMQAAGLTESCEGISGQVREVGYHASVRARRRLEG